MPALTDSALEVLDLSGFFRVLTARRKYIFLIAGGCFLLAGIACLVMTPRYTATAQVELLKQQQGAINVGQSEGQTGTGATQAEDSLNFSLSLQTAVEVLSSDELALRVYRELNLGADPDFAYNPLVKDEEVKREMALPIDSARLKREAFLKAWGRRLKVSSDAGTQIISVSFKHSNPDTSARMVNQLITDYVDYRYELRFSAYQRSAEWLKSRLGALRSEAEDASKRFAEVAKDSGSYGNSDQDHNIIVARLDQLNSALAEAQSVRAAKEAIYNLSRNGDPELIAGLVNGGSISGSSASSQGNVLVSLKQQEADLNAQYAEASGKYGSENPKLSDLKRKRDSVRDEIKEEVKKIAGRARQEYMAAVHNETAANAAFEEEKRIASEMSEKTAAYDVARHEADAAQQLYQSMLASSKQSSILAGVRSTDLNLISPAIAPGKPASPNVPLFLAAGLAFGLFAGVISAFVLDTLDTHLRDPEDVERLTNKAVLGIIPQGDTVGKGKRIRLGKAGSGAGPSGGILGGPSKTSAVSPTASVVMEAFRSLRSSILLSGPDNPRQVFLLTSAQPGEGKSFAALHLAAVLSQSGSSVLLVDGDLRRGTLSRTLNQFSRSGLSTLLANPEMASASYRTLKELPGVTFVPSGAAPPNPAESLGSKKMYELISAWREQFDYVVFDSAPVLPVTDAVVLSQHVDGVLLVVRAAVSTRKGVQRALHLLTIAHAECFGVLVNGVDASTGEYGLYGYDNQNDGSSGEGPRTENDAVQGEQ